MATPEHFDAVVIGSGFGGSVMAYRLAKQNLRVCVLERGQAYAPGSFPRAPHMMKDNFWDPSAGLYGMYNVWFFRHVGALVSSCLGGGSQIYASVMLRKDEKWFVREDLQNGGHEHWPLERRDLDPHYDAVEAVLKPQTYPSGGEYDRIEKVKAFRDAAQRVASRRPDCTVVRAPLAVTLFNDPARPMPGEPIVEEVPNRYGVPRRTCVLCASCVVGCNHGAKNTLDLTYLSRAERASTKTEIRERCEVRSFRPRPGRGYEVSYVEHDVEAYRGVKHDTGELSTKTITCDRLVVAAGTMGSAYLMMKNAASFANLPRRPLGTRFSGNGDLMSFALMCSRKRGDRVEPWRVDATQGPTITHALRRADALDTGRPTDGRGFYIEDAAFPPELAWLIESINPFGMLRRGWRFARQIVRKMVGWDGDTDLGAELSELLGTADLSSRTLPLLGMGRDVPDGVFAFDEGRNRLKLDWSKQRSAAYFDGMVEIAGEIARELGGTYRLNPFAEMFRRAVTVHPLGGVPMGRHRDEGVVDSWGRVFGHPGFVVVDGSILPGPVGPNPALTIAAIADRAADRLLEWPGDAGWPA
jgi:cholesterol oxidase